MANARTALRRLRRRAQVKALLLIAPLALFLAIIFIVPIGLLLTRSVDNREVGANLKETSAALASWDGNGLPGDAAFVALARDFKAAPRDAVAEVAKRINDHSAGMRSLILKSSRNMARTETPATADALRAIDPAWEKPATWLVLKGALPAYTDFYLLAAVDLQRDSAGAVTSVPESDALYREVLQRTFEISLAVTVICLLLSYPLAYGIASAGPTMANAMLICVLLPFWTSLLVRTTAWVVLLQSGGVINSFLGLIGIIDPEQPLALIHNRTGVLIAMTHILLPFMVLPIYSVMKGIPPVYIRAATSLGAPPWQAFLRVYLPMSLPGVSAGCLLVFILALGYYITPSLVGGPRDQMVSYFIAYFANQVTNWGMAAALSGILLGLVLVLYAMYSRLVGLDRLRIG